MAWQGYGTAWHDRDIVWHGYGMAMHGRGIVWHGMIGLWYGMT